MIAPKVWRNPRWLLVGVYAATIFWLSHQSSWVVALPDFRFADKAVHAIEFGLLCSLALFALGERARELSVLLATTGAVVAYGVLDEIHQAFVPGRFSDPLDAAADAAGACLIAALHFAWSRARATRARSRMREGGSI